MQHLLRFGKHVGIFTTGSTFEPGGPEVAIQAPATRATALTFRPERRITHTRLTTLDTAVLHNWLHTIRRKLNVSLILNRMALTRCQSSAKYCNLGPKATSPNAAA